MVYSKIVSRLYDTRILIIFFIKGMMTKESYVGIVLSVIQKFSYSEYGIIVKLILSIDRRNTLEEAMETVNLAIKYKNRGVVGVDLCGDPSVSYF